jgi:hypothetical protein
MRLHSIGYDLHRPGQDPAPIVQRLLQLDARPFLAPVWMLKSPANVWELREDLRKYLQARDRLLIADVTSVPLAWHNINIKATPFASLGGS